MNKRSSDNIDPRLLTAGIGGVSSALGALTPAMTYAVPAAVGGVNALTQKKEKGKAFLRGGVGTLGTMAGAHVGSSLLGTLPAGLISASGGIGDASTAGTIGGIGRILGYIGGGLGGYALTKRLMDNAMPYEKDKHQKSSQSLDDIVRAQGVANAVGSLAGAGYTLGVPAINVLNHPKEKSKAALRGLVHAGAVPTGITAGALMGGGLGAMLASPFAAHATPLPAIGIGGLLGAIAGGVGSYKLTNKLLDAHMPYKHNDEE